MPAPMSASATRKTAEAIAARRTRWPRPNVRNAQTSWTATSTIITPDVARWPNSTRVAMLGERGITSPLQVGQWLPHPAPEPLARTYAPQRMTPRVDARTHQANLRKPALFTAGLSSTFCNPSPARAYAFQDDREEEPCS